MKRLPVDIDSGYASGCKNHIFLGRMLADIAQKSAFACASLACEKNGMMRVLNQTPSVLEFGVIQVDFVQIVCTHWLSVGTMPVVGCVKLYSFENSNLVKNCRKTYFASSANCSNFIKMCSLRKWHITQKWQPDLYLRLPFLILIYK